MKTQPLFGRLLALMLAILLTVPAAAWADDGADAATEYYNQATVAYQQGDYQKAADLLDLAFGSNPDLVYKYNRILALQALGDFDTALAELNTMLGPMKADSKHRFDDVDDIKTQIEAAIKARDDAKNPPPDDTTPIEQPPEPAKSGPNYLGIGLLAGGGLVAATGVLFITAVLLPSSVKECLGIQASPNCDEYRDAGGDDEISAEEAQKDARSVQNTHKIAAVSLLAGGVVIAGVGAILLIMDGGGAEDPPQSAGLDSLRFSPYITQDGAGAAMQLRF